MPDNIDWKNKSIRGSSNETHHANCILIQNKEDQQLKQEKSPVTLHPNYNYNRKTHCSFKGMEINLPNNTAWKKSEPPKLSHNPDTKMKCEIKEVVKGLWCGQCQESIQERVKRLFRHGLGFKF